MFEQKSGQPQTPASYGTEQLRSLLRAKFLSCRTRGLDGLIEGPSLLCGSPLCLASPLRARQGCPYLHRDPGRLWLSTTPSLPALSPGQRTPHICMAPRRLQASLPAARRLFCGGPYFIIHLVGATFPSSGDLSDIVELDFRNLD